MNRNALITAYAAASMLLGIVGFSVLPKWIVFITKIIPNAVLEVYLFLLFLSFLARDAEPAAFLWLLRIALPVAAVPLLPAVFFGCLAYNTYTQNKQDNTIPAQNATPPQPLEHVSRPEVVVKRERNIHAFDRLVGVDHAISAIKDALEIPLMYPEKAREYGIKPSKGILFYGPPGTGKTSLARATAEYFGCYFVSVKASELVGPYVGTSEAAVKQLFAQARANKPAIIFFDEIDAIGRRRDGSHLNRPSDIVLNILLAEMDGFEKDEGVFVIGATNRVDVLDEALLRPGRFDSVIEIPLPDFKARKKLFSLYLRGRPISDEEFLNIYKLAELTEGMSPAQIEAICKKAALAALKREIEGGEGKGIRMSDLVAAIEEEKMAQSRQ